MDITFQNTAVYFKKYKLSLLHVRKLALGLSGLIEDLGMCIQHHTEYSKTARAKDYNNEIKNLGNLLFY